MAERLTKRGAKRRLAEKLGIPQSIVTNWVNGSRRPVSKTRAKLEELLGIRWTLWDEELRDSDPGDAA
jgi:transcriptional regulator with XRE-family HTH domain